MADNINKKLKVSIIAPTLSKGGLDRAYILGQALQILDHEVEILGHLFTEEIYPLPPPEIPVKSVPGGIYPQLFISGKKLLRAIDGDLILAVKPRTTSFGISLLKKVFARKPVILDIDDWELSWCGGDEWSYQIKSPKQLYRDLFKSDGQLRKPDHPMYLKWMEKLIPYADAVTADTDFLIQRFGGFYLPNGKDTQLFDPYLYDSEACRRKYDLEEYRVLMFPGAPRPHKGIEDVLKALDILQERDFRLVIIGGNPYDNYEKTLIKKWGQWIIKLPPFSATHMPEIVAAAHVVVVPQRQTLTAAAQFPLKITDGMAMAKPVLSTLVGDIPNILEETGYIVAPNSPQEIAQALKSIFNDYEVAMVKGRQARQRCIDRYSTKTISTILSGILEDILK